MSDERNRRPERGELPNDDEQLSLLEAFDRAVALLAPGDFARERLLILRSEIEAQEQMVGDAREMIEKLEQVIKKVTSPANRIGTFLGSPARETAQIVVGGADYYCNVDPRISLTNLRRGTRVLVNEAYVIVGDLGFETAGPGGENRGSAGRRSAAGRHGARACSRWSCSARAISLEGNAEGGRRSAGGRQYRVAHRAARHVRRRDEYYLDDVPELPWEKVGGQEEALQAIRDAIELPLLHADLFARFQHATPKGFLLYGPPGCGKTLIGKATAYNLTQQLKRANRRGDARVFHAHQGAGDSQHVGRRERAHGARDFCHGAREAPRGLPAVPLHRRSGEHPRHAPRRALLEHPLHARADVLHGDGRHRIARRSRHHPRLQSRRSDRPGDPAPRPHRPQDQGATARTDEGAREIYQHLPNERICPTTRALRKAESVRGGDRLRSIDEAARSAVCRARRESIPAKSRCAAAARRRFIAATSSAARSSPASSSAQKAWRSSARSRAGRTKGSARPICALAFDAEYLENEILPATDIVPKTGSS